MAKFLTDEEMAALESQNKPKFISDDEMAILDKHGVTEAPQQEQVAPKEESTLWSRFKGRNENVMAPTVAGEALGLQPGTVAEGIAGTPERAYRLAGGAVGTLADVAFTPASKTLGAIGSGIDKLTSGKISGAVKNEVSNISQNPVVQGAVKKGTDYWNSLPESVKANYRASGDFASSAGMGKTAEMALPLTRKITGGTLGKIGEAVEGVGKKTLAGEMKITKPVAKKAYGGTLEEKKAGIIDDIVNNNLESVTGNFKKMAEKAQEKASQKLGQADQIITEISKSNNAPLINPLDVIDRAGKGVVAAAGKGKEAEAIQKRIISDLVDRGYDANLTPDKLVEVKKLLNADGNIFANGPMASDADNLDRTIRKAMYLSIVDRIGEISPDVAELNRSGKRLLDISSAADEASSRTANHSFLGLGALGAGAGGYAHGGSLEAVAAALAGAGALKAAGQGRLSSAVIKTGKGIKSLGGIVGAGTDEELAAQKESLGNLARKLKDERGAVGVENPQIHTDNFKQWFGDWKNKPEEASKVVDAANKPIEVYHGTNSNFNKINTKKGSQGVFWFSSDKNAIQSGESGAQGTKKIMPLYADIKNPAGWKEYDKYGIDELEQMGYDGVILPEKDGVINGFVLNGSQVKSSIKNSGAFSKSTNNIRGSGAIPMLGSIAGLSGAGLGGYGLYKSKKDKLK